MKTRTILWLTALLNVASVALSADKPGKNLVSNPSLEEAMAADGLPEGWNGVFFMPEKAYQFAIATPGHTGKQSLRVQGDGKFAVVRANKLTVDRAKRYRARGWVKIEGDPHSAADVKFHYYAADGRYLDQSRIGFVNPRTVGWQQITLVDQLELFPEAATIELAVALAGKGKAWFDDLEMVARDEKRPAVTNWVANGDMEDIAADRPAGWFIVAAEGGTIAGDTSKDIKHSGKQSLHLKGNGAWLAAGSVKAPLDRGQTYTASAWIRGKTGKPALGIAYWEGEKFLGHSKAEAAAEAADWQKIDLAAKPDEHPTATHLTVTVGGETELEAWFDDVSLTATRK